MTTRHLLIVWHSRTGAAQQLASAAAAGATAVSTELNEPLTVQCLPAAQVTTNHWLQAQGYVLCAPENLGSLSGAMKECLDAHYYALEGKLAGRPYALAIAAGTDGEGARGQLERIATGWRLHLVAPALVARNGAQTRQAILAPKQLATEHARAAAELGGTVAGWLLMGA